MQQNQFRLQPLYSALGKKAVFSADCKVALVRPRSISCGRVESAQLFA